MQPLLEEAKGEQYAVLNAIFGQFEEDAEWPIWQYVDRRVGPPGTALAALQSMPRLRDTRVPIGWMYGWVWWENWGLAGSPNPNTTVQLTVAGIWALRFGELPRLYVELLRFGNERWAQLPLSPREAQYATISSHEVRQALFPKQPWGALTDKRLAQLRLLAQTEKPTFGNVGGLPDGSWQLIVRDDIIEWTGIETVEDYLNRMVEVVEPEPAVVLAESSSATNRQAPAWLRQLAELAAREDHRGYFVGAWAAVGTALAGVATTLLATGSSAFRLGLGVASTVLALASFWLMFAALFHLPPHRPRVSAQAQTAQAVATAHSPMVTVTSATSASPLRRLKSSFRRR